MLYVLLRLNLLLFLKKLFGRFPDSRNFILALRVQTSHQQHFTKS
ncbi:hypothetical protein [uncultured Pontibacter sp.]|nr:hypothetical protein [uncultured Pontibacter sp.]